MNDAIHSAGRNLRACLTQYTQDTRLLRLTTTLGPNALLVEGVDGQEGLSETYRFDITALSTDADIDANALLGQPALLQILSQHSRTDLRPVHGQITAVELVGSDGGFSRYRIRLEPWLAFLRYRRDSYIWQGKNVLDIVQEIFGDYKDRGKLIPAWRLAIEDASQYQGRDVCTQFEESDLDFIHRLLAEEGLFYWFEHSGDPASASFGSHALVIADHNGAFAPNKQNTIRYHRAASVEASDSITDWHAHRRITTNAVTLGSWNEAQVNLVNTAVVSVHNNGDVPVLAAIDHPGQRRFTFQAEIERAARRQLQALEARNKTYSGASTVRTLTPGTTFILTDHAIHDTDRGKSGDQAATFAVISVRHRGRNNLSSEARALIADLFDNSQHAGNEKQEEPLYTNRFTALRADIPWRPLTMDGRGALLHPKPNATGIHTAIVVGAPGEDLTTERDHRIKVQMHWQRGGRSQSRRTHPAGNDNAPGNSGAYIWVRVAEAAAGANWGSSFIPRIGQEVILDYIEGDIDRPIVVGSLYNGKGMEDGQGNQTAQGAGPAVGSAPAWFAGNNGHHAHNAILSGFKTQEMGNSQDGQGGYNTLIFDDTTNQVGTRLQTTKTKAQLNLGHIKRQTDNERMQSHGHGAELTTEAYGAVRAGKGLLITADARPNASSTQMDAREAHAQLEQAHALQKSLTETARKHNAFIGKGLKPEQHTMPETILAKSIDSLAQTADGIGTPEGGGAGTVPAFGRPDLVVSAPGGISFLTPEDVHATASLITATGGVDVSATVGRNLVASVRDGISLFTYGDARARRKELGDKGIKLHAAHGRVDIQAQNAELRSASDKDTYITSTHAKIEAIAKDHVQLTAGGAYIKISDGNIQIHAPGQVLFKASMKALDGATSMSKDLPLLPKSDYNSFLELNYRWDDLQPMVGAPYKLTFSSGQIITGKLDADGFARIENTPKEIAFVTYGEDERDAEPRKKQKPNQVAGARPRTLDEAQAILDQYLAQEDAHYKDNYFPDELEELASPPPEGAFSSTLDYEFHYGDYQYEDEQDKRAEKKYRELHEREEE